jgi:hypothetical protein
MNGSSQKPILAPTDANSIDIAKVADAAEMDSIASGNHHAKNVLNPILAF